MAKKNRRRDKPTENVQGVLAPPAPTVAPAPVVAAPAPAGRTAFDPYGDDPALIRMLSPDGTLVAGAKPLIDDATLLAVHDTMRLIRALDEKMITLQRQGRAGFYGACTGEEAAVLGTASALRAMDWIVPALRQNSAMLLRGFPLTPYVA